MAQTVKHLSTVWETWVRSLGREVPWRRKWQPTPVLLPRKSRGQRSLVSMGLQRVGRDWETSLSLYNVDCILFCCLLILFNNWVEMTSTFDGWENGDIEEHSQDLEAGKWLSWEPYQGPLLASAGVSPLFQAPLWFKQRWVMMEWRGSFLSHFQWESPDTF